MEKTRTHRVVKRGELAIRRAFITFLSRRSLKSSPTLPLQLPDSPTILILRQDRFGDAIITTPLLVALKERYPTARLMVLLGEKNKSIAPLLPIECETFVYRKNLATDIALLWTIRKIHVDVLIDLQDNASATSSIITAAVSARYSIGIEKENASSYNVLAKRLDQKTVHISRRIAELLRPLGIDPDTISLQPKLNIPIPPRIAGRIAVNISVGKPSCWVPPHVQSQICALVSSVPDTQEVLVFAHPKDKKEQEEVIRLANTMKVKPAPLTNSFEEYASLLSSCEILLTPDTSTVHLGAALGIPMVAYYLQSSLHYWTPIGVEYRMLTKDNLQDISVNNVLVLFKELLDGVATTKASIREEVVR